MLKNSNMFQEQSTIQCSTQSNSVVFYCHFYESDVADDVFKSIQIEAADPVLVSLFRADGRFTFL